MHRPRFCRSALAREGVFLADIVMPDPPRSPASRLLQVCVDKYRSSSGHHRCTPDIFRQFAADCCRSRLAGECILSADIFMDDPPRSPASRLLQVCVDKYRSSTGPDGCSVRQTPVIHRLRRLWCPATTDHSPVLAAVALTFFGNSPRTTVGAGLLANAFCQPTPSSMTHRVRGQARSYRAVSPQTDHPPVLTSLCRQIPVIRRVPRLR
jgi:hypothetical protein